MAASSLAKFRFAATVGVTGVVLWLLLQRFARGSSLVSVVRGARSGWVELSFLASSACVLLGALRWRLILSAMGYDLPFRRALEVVLATWPLAMVAPARASDLLRPLAVRAVIPLAAGTGSVLAEKAIDLLVLLLFAAVGAATRGFWVWAAAIGALGAGEVLGVAMVKTQRRWLERFALFRNRRDAMDQLLGAIEGLRRAPAKFFAQVLASVAIRFLTITILHVLLVSVGARVRLFDTTTLWPVACLVGLAPVTLAGVGTRDAAFIRLLTESGAHADSSQVLAATMGYSAVAIGSFAVIGLPFMIREMLRDRQRRDARPMAAPTC